MKYRFLLALLSLGLFACQTDDELLFEPPVAAGYANVDQELWSYFQYFEEQAALRGHTVDLEAAGITAFIEELDEQHVAGQCSYGGGSPSEIVIDLGFWNNTNSRFWREMVVFHELGHCFLHRGHREGTFDDGTCLSIMRSGLEDCIDNYNSVTRDEYLDELFSVLDE